MVSYGPIMEEIFFFDISNAYESSFNIGDVVDYILQQSGKQSNKNEAAEIKLAENYTEEFKLMRDSLNGYKWGMVMKGNPLLFKESLNYDLNRKDELLQRVDSHVESTEIDLLLDSYQVKVTSGGTRKPGDGDTAWVCISNIWLYDVFSWEELAEYKNDIYIEGLLPTINKVVYKERAFCPWRRMISEYQEDKENWEKLEKEALNLESEIKEKAKIKYNKLSHKAVLKEYLEQEVKMVLNKYTLELKRLTDYWKYDETTAAAAKKQ